MALPLSYTPIIITKSSIAMTDLFRPAPRLFGECFVPDAATAAAERLLLQAFYGSLRPVAFAFGFVWFSWEFTTYWVSNEKA